MKTTLRAESPNNHPRVSTAAMSGFAAYCRRYVRRNFHALRVLKSGLPPRDSARPIVIYLNHAAWWDPLVCLLLTREFFLERTSFAPIDWHVHEMVYGYLPAIITGFLLTAIPNWTGRLPLQGTPLVTLLLLWAAGRAAISSSAQIGWSAAAVIDCGFLLAMAMVGMACGACLTAASAATPGNSARRLTRSRSSAASGPVSSSSSL